MGTRVKGPRARARRHDWIDERSRALHRAIAGKIRLDPTLVGQAQDTLERWESIRGPQPSIREWRQILKDRSLAQLLQLLVENTEESKRLRQSSPFTRVLTEAERSAIFARYESL